MTKSVRVLGLSAVVGLFSAGAWLACGTDSTTPAADAGSEGGSSSGSSGSSGSSSGSGSSSSSSSSGGSSSSSSSSGGSSSGGMKDGGDAGEGGIVEAGEAAPPATCASYCALIETTCTGANAQYAAADAGGTTECMNACQYWDQGDADNGQNSLQCRYHHTLNALAVDAGGLGLGANPHCWHAGPYGWGVCGTQCADFCQLAVDYCSPAAGFDAAAPPYAALADCLGACPNFAPALDAGNAIVAPDGSAGSGSYTGAGPTSGNTRDCREYHLGAALQSSALQQIHCQHPGDASPTCM
jgi:hypothetical protein